MISVVVPAFNEVSAVSGVVSGALSVLSDHDEVLVVDDGSSDGTGDAAQDAGARVLMLDGNSGKGEALRTGMEKAEGDILVFIDADGQDDPSEIPVLLEALEPGVAMVIGSRFRGRLLEGSITTLNRVGNMFLTRVFNVLYGCALTDTQAGFRALRRDAIDPGALSARRYEIETELTLHVLKRGGRVREVPVTRSSRDGGETGFIRAYDGLRILKTMINGRFRP